MKRLIFTGFSPNTAKGDAWRAARLLMRRPWQRGTQQEQVKKLEQWFQQYFFCKYAVAFDSGRSALEKALQAGGVGPGDEVILQAFTCIVVANSVTNLGAVPVYADCTDHYTLDVGEVKKKITGKTKALIIQHTFGAPADIESLMAVAQTHDLLVIEDCAHSLGGEYKGQLLGTFGDVSMFSFGSDKVISGVRGGMAITNNPDLGGKLKKIQADLPRLPVIIELQHLFHPIFFWLGRNLYHLFIGKIILGLAQKLHLINKIIYRSEKQGKVPSWFPARLPNALAVLALEQIKNLDSWNAVRKQNAAWYVKEFMNKKSIQKMGTADTWLRFPVEVADPKALRERARREGIVIGDWYACPIAPCDSSANAAHYPPQSCPKAEQIARSVVNLPTDPSLSPNDLKRVAELF